MYLPVIMKTLGIQKIYGICDAENIASCKVLEKCGFYLEYEGSGKYQGQERQIKKYVYEVNRNACSELPDKTPQDISSKSFSLVLDFH